MTMINCPHRSSADANGNQHPVCLLASRICGRPAVECQVNDDLCRACLEIAPGGPTLESPTWLAASVAVHACDQAGDKERASDLRAQYADLFRQSKPVRPARPKLTIGMATYDDFDGVYFTLQSLRLMHPEVMPLTEMLVVDNHPQSSQGRAVRDLIESWIRDNGLWGSRYIAAPETTGTSAPRDRVFREAAGEVVACIDSHVLICPGALRQLLMHADKTSTSLDLWQGPMVYDNLLGGPDHMDPVWRGEMYGVWGSTWVCPGVVAGEPGRGSCGRLFSVQREDEKTGDAIRYLDLSGMPLAVCVCGRGYPPIAFSGHESTLRSNGYTLAVEMNKPFPIPMMGLGLFACRKEAWLGFNPAFSGFGGEEGYIHAKFAREGRQTWCLPFLKWVHRFGRPASNGAPYPLRRLDKCRNYLIGSKELGLPIGDIYRHFVQTGRLLSDQWEALVREVYGDGSSQGKPVVPITPPPLPVEEPGNRPQEFLAPLRLGLRFAAAAARHAWNGFRKLDSDQVAARLAVCNTCDLVKKNKKGEPSRCTHPACGCYLAAKAVWASEDCPLQKWPAAESNEVAEEVPA